MELSLTALSDLSTAAYTDARQVRVLKKALESQEQLALGLLQALPPAPSASPSSAHLPAHLGQHINTTA